MVGSNQGSSLIEIIVALFLVGITATGSAHLLRVSQESIQSSNYRSQAHGFALSVVEKLQVIGSEGHGLKTMGVFFKAKRSSPDFGACDPRLTCSSRDRAFYVIQHSKKQLEKVLPSSSMTLMPCETGQPLYCVFVGWSGMPASHCRGVSKNPHCLKVVAGYE